MIMSARPPLRSKLVLVAPLLGKAALMGGDLSRRRSARVLAVQKCFDVLAPARERHHLFAGVSFQLPTSVGRGHADLIPKRLYFAGKFRAINRGRKALAPIDLDRIETSPHAIRPKRHVGDYDVGVEVRIGAVAISRTGLRWSCGDVVEAGGHDRSEEHTSELQSLAYLVCRLLLEKKKKTKFLFIFIQKKTNTTK